MAYAVTCGPPLDRLSPPELRVACLCAQGHSDRTIGRELYLSVNIVKTHLSRVLCKLGVTNRAELVATLMLDLRFRDLYQLPVDTHAN